MRRVWIGLVACLLASCAQAQTPPASLEAAAQAMQGKNYAIAIANYRALAVSGNPQAMLRLGYIYLNGTGVDKDLTAAAGWFRKAADAGNADAQFRLGLAYANGLGVGKDDAQAAVLIRRSADQGFASAQQYLGFLYSVGRGVPKDPPEAVRWTVLAAEQGDSQALIYIGQDFLSGFGVPRNEAFAYFWATVPLQRGATDPLKERANTIRNMAKARLSIAAVERIEGLAKQWAPGKGSLQAVSLLIGKDSLAASGTTPKLGSGFVVAREGRVVTNQHVIANCKSVFVRTDKGETPAEIVAEDAANDLALLKTMPMQNVTRFRDARPLRLGEPVLAAGFPLGGVLNSDVTVTTGTVSALTGAANDSARFQITAPIQPGNSGGPLFDSSGALIGIVQAKLNAPQVAAVTGDIPENIAFAIKESLVRNFLESHGVAVQTAAAGRVLPTADISDIARKVALFVACKG